MPMLELEIKCGSTTCAWEPGKFCQYLGVRRLGTESVCLLFPDPEGQGAYTRLKDEGGWVQRCRACLGSEKRGR